jgi:nucleotide-binding universal stress UspA family protein
MIVSRYFSRPLVPVSFSERTSATVSYARKIAATGGGEVILLHVVPTQTYRLNRAIYRPEQGGGANSEFAEKVARELLEKIAGEQLRGVRYEIVIRHSANPAEAILKAQEELEADTIVVSKSDLSALGARLQGGLCEKLIRTSLVPVWSTSTLDRYAEVEAVKNVLVPVTFDRPSIAAIRLGGSIAATQGGRVKLFHVVLSDDTYLDLRRDMYGFNTTEPIDLDRAVATAKRKLAELADQELDQIPHETGVKVGSDRAATILTEEKSWLPDIIVTMTSGLTGFFQAILGSNAETLARDAMCSVATMRIRE